MSRFGLTSLVLLFSVIQAVAADPSNVTFDETIKDLGGIPRGTKILHQFKFTNTSQQTVHISGVRTSCHCSTAWPAKETVTAGESSAIIVQVNTGLYAGSRDFTIYVNFDRPTITETRLMLKTVSREDISLSPEALSFGMVRLGSAPTAEVALEHRSLQGWKITGIENENGYLQPKLEPLANHPNGYKLSVRLREDTPAGLWHASIGLVTNDPTSPRIFVPLSVEVQGSLAITPQALNLGRVGQTSVDKKVVVRGAKPFKIISVEGTDGILAVDPVKTDEAKIAHVLKITYSGKADAGELLKKLKIVTDLDHASIELPVQGTVNK